MTFIDRLDSLLKAEGLTRKRFLEIMKFGKNQITTWEKNLAVPNNATLEAIASYFGVSVDYLLGIEDEQGHVTRVKDTVIRWLLDNGYEYEEDLGDVCITRYDQYIHRTTPEFERECMMIKKLSSDGFNLAMNDWERRNFSITDSCNQSIEGSSNVITDSPNATITVNEPELSKQERELVEMYRDFTLEQQLMMLTHMLKIKKGEI